MEDIPAGEAVTAGKFIVNQYPAVILFDSGASHSFMSETFATKCNPKVDTVEKGGYCISAAGNNINTNRIVRDVKIEILGRTYMVNLVVLPGLGIDIILDMNWMSKIGVLIDTSTGVVMMREPVGKEAFLVPLSLEREIFQLISCSSNRYPI